MADILYLYGGQVYANITNICNCNCTFCIRRQHKGIGDSSSLWHSFSPSSEEVIDAIKQFDFSDQASLVYCGYGEPTCNLEVLLDSANFIKRNHKMSIRVNTNGLGNVYNGFNILPRMAEVVDSLSISLNAPDSLTYQQISLPSCANAFDSVLEFIKEAKLWIPDITLSIVDVLPKEKQEACKRLASSLSLPLRVRTFAK